jgi:hypothetical protein
MPEKINFRLGVPGRDPAQTRPKMSLTKAIQLIKAKNYAPSIEQGLLAALSRCPANTYEKFLVNIHTHLRRLQAKSKAKKEENDRRNEAQKEGESGDGQQEVSGDELLDS